MAEYYGAPIGLTLRSMLPAGLWGESQVVAVASPRPVEDRRRGRRGAGRARASEAGRLPCPSLARALKRPVWDAVAPPRFGRRGRASGSSRPTPRARTATERVVALHGEPPTLLERATLFKRRARQRALYEALESLGGSAQVRHLVEQLGFGEAVIRGLVSQRARRRSRARSGCAIRSATPPARRRRRRSRRPRARRWRRSRRSRPARARSCSA